MEQNSYFQTISFSASSIALMCPRLHRLRALRRRPTGMEQRSMAFLCWQSSMPTLRLLRKLRMIRIVLTELVLQTKFRRSASAGSVMERDTLVCCVSHFFHLQLTIQHLGSNRLCPVNIAQARAAQPSATPLRSDENAAPNQHHSAHLATPSNPPLQPAHIEFSHFQVPPVAYQPTTHPFLPIPPVHFYGPNYRVVLAHATENGHQILVP
jgi:hypothetical protein